uniref:Uncharacterized protein n=1 Tax=Rhizophora mucronata TaxID=61149 RepID=A0A2P2PQ31_RHIMU
MHLLFHSMILFARIFICMQYLSVKKKKKFFVLYKSQLLL